MYQWMTHFARIFVAVAVALPMVLAPHALVARPAAQGTDSPVIVAAGDIANCHNREADLTAYLVETIGGTVLPIGDLAYEVGSITEFNNCYGPTWGRFKDRTRPAPGNHEYGAGNASGYFTYFGDIATPLEPGCTNDCKGYYSYRLGEWVLFALNSEIPSQTGSEQEQWLRAQLAANPSRCTLAYWHRPMFTSGRQRGAAIDLYRALYDYGADVVLVAHEHNYERFAPQDPNGQLDNERGIRQFVVGTGGAPLHDFRFIQPNSEVRNSETFGVLKMTLHPDSYDWEFIPIEGQTFADSGSGACVMAPGVPAPPAAPAVAAAPASVTTTAAPAAANTTTVAAPAANPAAALPAAGLNYTVQSGDTLSLISARYGLDWRQVAQVNQLANPEIIEVGQVIRLPGVQGPAATTANQTTGATQPVAGTGATTTTAPTTAANPAGRYTVQAGDTLSSIAARYNLTWQALAAANGLTGADFIRVGQVLTIPGQAGTTNVGATVAAPTTVVSPTVSTATTPTTVTTAPVTAAPTTTGATTTTGSSQFHTVASGETIITIAARYGLNWRQLLELNGLQENSILQIGQQIRLR
jgi:LysM repeat protein